MFPKNIKEKRITSLLRKKHKKTKQNQTKKTTKQQE